MLKELLKVANRLDYLGLSKEADTIDAIIRKIADANIPPMAESTVKVDTSPIADNKDPAKILGVKTVQDVQFQLTAIQNALNNPDDFILGKNKDETAIKAYKSLALVLGQAIVETDIATQLSDVRESANDWISWINKGGRTPDPASKRYYDFLAAAAGRLSAGKPVFDFKTSTLSALDVLENAELKSQLKSQDAKWASYISQDKRRAPIRDAWSKFSLSQGSNNISSFDEYVLWWKTSKQSGVFDDGNAGGIAATIARLKVETNQD